MQSISDFILVLSNDEFCCYVNMSHVYLLLNNNLCYLNRKKLDSNYTRILRAIFNKSWRQHPTKHQLYGHLPPITKIIQVRRTRHAGHCWRSRDELISDVLLWTPTYGRAKVGRPARTYIQDTSRIHTFRIRDVSLKTCQRRWTIGRSGERGSGIHTFRIRDVSLKTCQRRWTIGRSGERGSGISVLAAWHDDDDDDIYMNTHTHMYNINNIVQKCSVSLIKGVYLS